MSYVYKIEQKSGPYWYVRFKTPGGTWKTEAGGRLKKNAEAKLKQRDKEIANGTYEKLHDITFREFSAKWLQDYAAIKVKPSTYAAYAFDNKKHLVPYFGRKLLRNITPGDVQGYVSAKTAEGLAPRTIGKNLTVLRLMLKHAIIWEYLDKDPARFVERPRVPHKEMDFLRPPDIERLLEASPADYKALFATAVLTGARQGELIALRWGDVDLERGVMFIRRTYHKRIGFAEPKSKAANRAVSLSPELVNILFEHQQTTGGDPDALVFSRDGEPLVGSNMVRDVFHPALKRAGIRQIRFHDLRHTYAALMISLDANMKWLQHQLGHSSITTTMDRYGHLLEEVGGDMPGKLDCLVFAEKIVHPAKRVNE